MAITLSNPSPGVAKLSVDGVDRLTIQNGTDTTTIVGNLVFDGNLSAVDFGTSGNTAIGDSAGDVLSITGTTNTIGNLNVLGNSTFDGNVEYTGTLTGGTGVINIGSGQLYKTAAGLFGMGTTAPAYVLEINSVSGGSLAVGDAAGQDLVLLGGATPTIVTPAANPLVLSTNNIERFRIDSAGNVGIGTATPAYKLDVRGVIAGGNGTIVGGVSFSSRAEIGAISNHDLGLIANNDTKMIINTAGNAGLGVTPSAWRSIERALDVGISGSLTSTNLNTRIYSNSFVNSSNQFIYKATGFAQYFALNSDGSYSFNTAPSGTAGNPITFTQAMTLTQSGNLLVGTTIDPGARFVVQTTNTGVNFADNAVIRGQSNGSGLAASLSLSNNVDAAAQISLVGTSMALGLNGAEKARITSAGNLLVGTTTDTGYRISAKNISAGILGLSNNEHGLTIAPVTAGTNVFNLFADIGSLRFTAGDSKDQAANLEFARFTNGYFKASNTGVYSAPNENTHEFASNVAARGSLTVSHTSTLAGSDAFATVLPSGSSGFHINSLLNGVTVYRVLANGNVQNTNNSYGAISDAKLKENVVDTSPKLEDVKQLRVVNYNLISNPELKQIGLIAQEVEQIFPGLVDSTPDIDSEGNDLGTVTKSVKYSVLVPILLKAMQEQQEIIEDLKARLDAAGL